MRRSAAAFVDAVRDLRRRKVFRAAATYGVGAWLIIEMCSVVLPALQMPDWALRFVIVAAAAGFVPFLIFAWIFDLTAEGLVRSPEAAEVPADSSAPSGSAISASRAVDFVVILLLILLATWLWLRPAASSEQTGAGPSIAVLAFQDLSEAGDSEYFANGIAEELLNSLAKIDGLHVPSRTSSFAFRNSSENIRSIGEQLNVQTVLEGSVRRVGDDVRITAQLTNVNDGFNVWSETYDRKLNDIFQLQDEIAQAIVEALKEHIGAGSRMMSDMSAATSEVASIEAYDLYLLGRHHWHKRTVESLNRSVELFERAIEADETYAPAYTGLADAYLLLAGYGDLEAQAAQRKAEPLIATALSLDPALGESYASQGLLRWTRGDLAAAELALRAAVARNPNYSMAHMWLGGVLGDELRIRESLAAYQDAWAVDPLHPVINSNLAGTLLKMGRIDEARAAARRMTEVGAETGPALLLASEIEAQAGNVDTAVRIATDGAARHPDNVKLALMNARYHAMLGNQESSRLWLAKAESAGLDDMYLQPMVFAILLRLGEIDRFVEAADQMLSQLPDWRTAATDKKLRHGILWPAVARIIAGRYAEGSEMLKVTRADEPLMGLSSEDRVAILTLQAYAESRLGEPENQVQSRLDRAFEIAQEALANGWNTPGLLVRVAVVEAMRGNTQAAVRAMNTAVDAGWRDTSMELRLPFSQVLQSPDFQATLQRVQSDLQSMRQQLIARR